MSALNDEVRDFSARAGPALSLGMTEVLMRPGFPAFADRFGVMIDVDILHTTDAFSHRIGRVFEFFFHSA